MDSVLVVVGVAAAVLALIVTVLNIHAGLNATLYNIFFYGLLVVVVATIVLSRFVK